MNDIYSIAAMIAAQYPCDTIRHVAGKIGMLGTPNLSESALRMQWASSLQKNPLIKQFCKLAEDDAIASGEISSILLSACATWELVSKSSAIDILWTGPQTTAVRQTEQALCELIDSAKKDIFIVSFVAYKADKVYNSIRSAIDRKVTVRFLTEASKKNGLKKMFPEAEFYRWDDDSSSSSHVVHAKCAIADADALLVTSANLTSAAMSKNMELGLLLRDGRIAGKLQRHFKALIDEHTIRRV